MIRKIFFITCLAVVFSSCTLSDINRDNFVKTSSSAAGGYIGYHLSDGDAVYLDWKDDDRVQTFIVLDDVGFKIVFVQILW